MSTALPPIDAMRRVAADLAESTRLKAQSEQDRFLAEMSLPPIQPPSADDNGLMPASGTEGQRSRYRQYSYDRPGADQPAETREPLDS